MFLPLLAFCWCAMVLSASAFVVSPQSIARPSLMVIAPTKIAWQPLLSPTHRPTGSFPRLVLQTNAKPTDETDDEEDDAVIFNDFDFVIGDASSGESTRGGPEESLNERIRETQEQELYRDTKLMQNWKRGDWSVRGFSLDPGDALHDAAAEHQCSGGVNYNPTSHSNSKPIHVSKVVPDVNSDGRRIWVGRSNGSLVWVQLGTEYITHFRSKISGTFASSSDNQDDDDASDNKNSDDEDAPSSLSVQFGSELVREESFSQLGSSGEASAALPTADPFTILAQFSPANNSEGSAVSTILSVPDEDCIFTACEGSGQIQQWHISDDDIDGDAPAVPLQTPLPLSEAIHNGPIVALKVVSYQEAPLLLSVGADGSMALWDIAKADLVYHCQVCLDDDEIMEVANDDFVATDNPGVLPSRLVHCADVNDHHIYLGTASGHVLGYAVKDLVESGGNGGTCPLPRGKFKAHEGGVTAIACGGPGSLGRLSGGGGGATGKTTSDVLFTGGGNGLVKQWEMLSSPSMQKIENWPKLSSQRLPKKAHMFEGHDGPITALEAMGGRRPQFLSASADGTIRAWDVAKGKEEYRMDGFNEDLSSLCLQGGGDNDDGMLITNGMKQYVLIHDFFHLSGESVDDYYDQWDD